MKNKESQTRQQMLEKLSGGLKTLIEANKSYTDNRGIQIYCSVTLAKDLVDIIEKRIPKKAEEGNELWTCPTCRYEVWYMLRYKHCPNCGQALDWEKE